MTDNTPQPVVAGWYADHTDPALQRWWDGLSWTEHTRAGYPAGGVELKAPEGTSWNTPWIWLVIFLPLLSYTGLFFFNVSGLITRDPAALTAAMTGLVIWSIVYTTVGLLLTAALIAFAYFDWRELKRRGVPEPFHWAFAFLGVVYPIGRAVVTNRRIGDGLQVLWASIAVFVIGIVGVTIWSILFSVNLMQQLVEFGVR